MKAEAASVFTGIQKESLPLMGAYRQYKINANGILSAMPAWAAVIKIYPGRKAGTIMPQTNDSADIKFVSLTGC